MSFYFISTVRKSQSNEECNLNLIYTKRETVTVSLFRRIEISLILYGTPYGVKRDAGYGDGKIVFKYAAFSVLSCLISSIVGLLVGIFLLPHAIFPAFSGELFMPALASTFTPFPVFGHRSFRYKAHFIMTVVCVAGSTALVFAGFSLLNVSKGNGSIAMISAFIIAFALLLCVFVIYNLTNMNIGERKREIATLKVLGYRDGEVTGYIYREIFIMAFIGALLGIPLGCALVGFVFAYLDYGSLADIKWWSFVLYAAVVLVFIGLVDLLLSHKIRAVDMTSSLKSID